MCFDLHKSSLAYDLTDKDVATYCSKSQTQNEETNKERVSSLSSFTVIGGLSLTEHST